MRNPLSNHFDTPALCYKKSVAAAAVVDVDVDVVVVVVVVVVVLPVGKLGAS